VSPRVLIAGGGTGGHVFPMLAVGEALRREDPSVELSYVGSGRGMERRLIADLEVLEVLPLRGGGFGGFMRGATRAVSVLPRARGLVKRLKPDVVFSVGGYAAGPVTLAAWTLRVPVTLLEPNAVAGFTNRLIAPLAVRAYVCFPETETSFGARSLLTGVPLRRRFEPSPYRAGERVRILIMGGSQGAKALNETLPHALAQLGSRSIDIVHQAGRDKDEEVRVLYRELGVVAEVVPFIEDVAAELERADVVIERAGAGSLAELCAIGRAAIVVPYPYAADDHQRHNAQSLERDGAAVCLLQSEATIDRFVASLQRLIDEPHERETMAARARARGRPDAATSVARDLLALAATRRVPRWMPMGASL
jgi:UDP-N-acetylglucosamine--N-acetylmuramyl-(pentapeptide) pyrophosphoryl-undecaprenol N-acetylglucosamine transferase